MRIPKRAKTTRKTERRDLPEGDLPPERATPARRALAVAGIQRLEQLSRIGEDELKQLYGIGPNALAQLRRALAAQSLLFRGDREIKVSS